MNSRTHKIRIARGGGLLAAGIGGLLAGLTLQYGRGHLPFWIMLALLAIILTGSIAAQLPLWRNLDHMECDGRYVSWYWGGICAGSLALFALLAAKGLHSEMAMGAIILWVAQMAAYLGGRVAWRLMHRASA